MKNNFVGKTCFQRHLNLFLEIRLILKEMTNNIFEIRQFCEWEMNKEKKIEITS